MTEQTDQERARDQAAHELARRLERVTSLKDPYAAARDFITWMTDDGWYHRDRPPEIRVKPNPEAYERGAAAARQALRKDHHSPTETRTGRHGHTGVAEAATDAQEG